jgi:hypothetical protein
MSQPVRYSRAFKARGWQVRCQSKMQLLFQAAGCRRCAESSVPCALSHKRGFEGSFRRCDFLRGLRHLRYICDGGTLFLRLARIRARRCAMPSLDRKMYSTFDRNQSRMIAFALGPSAMMRWSMMGRLVVAFRPLVAAGSVEPHITGHVQVDAAHSAALARSHSRGQSQLDHRGHWGKQVRQGVLEHGERDRPYLLRLTSLTAAALEPLDRW